ncbi:MAG: hypothetical protein KDA54_04845 [Phycisphaerales bacterium]|nr:hypothetical protein [Phycisphaerales bacterium]
MAKCQLEKTDDALIAHTVEMVRRSYGEDEILADALDVMQADLAAGNFQTEHLVAAIRQGLPDPSAEGNKPPQLTTYRSQTAELVAKAALSAAYPVEYPAAPQEGAPNPNQPILGFDGWGICRYGGDYFTLVLIQVKGTDDGTSPPAIAEELANECRRVPRDTSVICRALCVLARLLRGGDLQPVVFRMLETLGRGELPSMHVAPAIVRGTVPCQIGDLQPCRDAVAEFAPATARGIAVGIGVSLSEFGETVMTRAREAA